MKIWIRHPAGVLSGGRLLVGGLGVVALAAGASAVALKAGVGAPSARLQPDPAALTRVIVSGHAAQLESVRATGPGGVAIPVSVRDGRVWPTVDLPVGEKVVVTATISRSAPVSWVLGRTFRLQRAVRTPEARISSRWLEVPGRLARHALVRRARRPCQHPLGKPPRGAQAAAHVALAHAPRNGVSRERAHRARRRGATHLGDPSRPRARHLVRGGRSAEGGRDPAAGSRRARPRRGAAPDVLATGQRDLRQAPARRSARAHPAAGASSTRTRSRSPRTAPASGSTRRSGSGFRAQSSSPGRPKGTRTLHVEWSSRLDAPAAAAAREPRVPARPVGAVRHAGRDHGSQRSRRRRSIRRPATSAGSGTTSPPRCARSGAPARSPR